MQKPFTRSAQSTRRTSSPPPPSRSSHPSGRGRRCGRQLLDSDAAAAIAVVVTCSDASQLKSFRRNDLDSERSCLSERGNLSESNRSDGERSAWSSRERTFLSATTLSSIPLPAAAGVVSFHGYVKCQCRQKDISNFFFRHVICKKTVSVYG